MASKRSMGTSANGSGSQPKQRKRQVSVATFQKWQSQQEKEHKTLSWLRCDKQQKHVETLWCATCRRFDDRIRATKNFSTAWITGSTNQKLSNVLDHARSEQHKSSMSLLRVEQAKATNAALTTYAPIAKSLLSMDKSLEERMGKKFDICYVLAKENLAFRKYPVLHELESRHGVDLGQSYATKDSAKLFTHFIAESQRSAFMQSLSTTLFCSFLMDGTTDAGKVEDQLIVIMSFCKDDSAGEVRSFARYFSIEVPTKADSDGLIACLQRSLQALGVDNLLSKESVLAGKPILIGGGTDGASVNVAEQNGMKGKMQRELPWLFWAWCYAHRLELACKDSFTSDLFNNITDMLLRLYYLYSKSPKKLRELTDVVSDLRQVFEFPKGGDAPIRSQGSRWISHKRQALQRIIDRYGAYIGHLTALAEDSSVPSTERARLKGYLSKWQEGKILIGCALYVDSLKASSILSKVLQGEKLDIVLGLQNILKSRKSLQSLTDLDPLQWPTVKLVRNRLTNGNEYQGATLKHFNEAMLKSCKDQALADVRRLEEKMKERLEWSDVKLLRAILVFLDTQTWRPVITAAGDSDSETSPDDKLLTEVKAAVELIANTFREPLEAVGVNVLALQDEVIETVEYARNYLSVETEKYHKVWYKLHVCPDADRWTNVLVLCKLCFSLPFSNGSVERMFSSLKLAKSDRRTRLHHDTLTDLLEIRVEGPPLETFSPKQAVEAWWKDSNTTRRPYQSARKEYAPRKTAQTGASTSSATDQEAEVELQYSLSEWDAWFDDTDSNESETTDD